MHLCSVCNQWVPGVCGVPGPTRIPAVQIDWGNKESVRSYYEAMALFSTAGWGGQHPEPNWLKEEISAHGFTPVDFEEARLG